MHKFVHHLAEMRSEKTQNPLILPGTGVAQGLSGHIMLNCSNRRFCVVLWQQKEGLDQLQKHFPSPGLPFQPQIIKKKILFGVGAPQWRCLTQVVVASHSLSFCCCFNVCKVEWKRHRNSWLSFPGRAVQLHLGAQQEWFETLNGDKGATISGDVAPATGSAQRAAKISVPHPPPPVTSPCLSAA